MLNREVKFFVKYNLQKPQFYYFYKVQFTKLASKLCGSSPAKLALKQIWYN
jgi:hypothetical protein